MLIVAVYNAGCAILLICCLVIVVVSNCVAFDLVSLGGPGCVDCMLWWWVLVVTCCYLMYLTIRVVVAGLAFRGDVWFVI